MLVQRKQSHVASLGAASSLAYSCGLQPSPTGRPVHCDPGVTPGVTRVGTVEAPAFSQLGRACVGRKDCPDGKQLG